MLDQIEVASKDFLWQRQITDTFTIYVNKFVLSDKVSRNKEKDGVYCELSIRWRINYTAVYQNT